MGNEGSKDRSDDELGNLSDGGFKKSPREIIDSVERERSKEREGKRNSRRKKLVSKLSVVHGKAGPLEKQRFSPASQEELSVATAGNKLQHLEVSEAEDPEKDTIKRARSASKKRAGRSRPTSPRVSPQAPAASAVAMRKQPKIAAFEEEEEESTSEEEPECGLWNPTPTQTSADTNGSSLDDSIGEGSSRAFARAAEEEQEMGEITEGSADERSATCKKEAPEQQPVPLAQLRQPVMVAQEAALQRDQVRRKARKMLQSSMDIQEFYAQLGFDKVEVGQLHEIFKESADGKEVLDFNSFNAALGRLEALGVQQMKDTPFAARLFKVFDSNNDKWVDKKEFLSGLGLLCKGTDEQKLNLTFSLYDMNGDGGISKEEIIDIFATTYEAKLRALAASNEPGVFKKMVDEEKLGQFVQQFRGVLASFVDGAFTKLDIDGNGLLDFEEFKAFAVSNPHVSAELNGLKRRVKMSLV